MGNIRPRFAQSGKGIKQSNGADQPLKNSFGYTFDTAIVKDFIEDPEVYLNSKFGRDGETVKEALISASSNLSLTSLLPGKETPEIRAGKVFKNPESLKFMPRGTVFAYLVGIESASQGSLPVICYPFFPPHFSLPVKAGERIWIISENTPAGENYYWMCRKHAGKLVDDINYTHYEREDVINGVYEDFLKTGEGISNSTLRSIAAGFSNTNPSNLPDNLTNDRLVFESSSSKNFTFEPIPPLRKKCGDTVIQGSNNAAIHLTTEKFKTSGNFLKSDFTKTIPSRLSDGRNPFAPAIDICVARNYSDLDSLRVSLQDTNSSGNLSTILSKRSNGFSTLESFELDKTKELQGEIPNEEIGIEDNPLDVGSRIYLSNDCDVDQVFSSAFGVLSSHSGPSVASFSSHNRVLANDSIRIANLSGLSNIDMDSTGMIQVQAPAMLDLKGLGGVTITGAAIQLAASSVSFGSPGVGLPSKLEAETQLQLSVGGPLSNPTEPYVIASVLEQVITELSAAITNLNAAIGFTNAESLTSSASSLALAATNVQNITTILASQTLKSTKIFGE